MDGRTENDEAFSDADQSKDSSVYLNDQEGNSEEQKQDLENPNEQVATEKDFSEKWKAFKWKYIRPITDLLDPFERIDTKTMENGNFFAKCFEIFQVFFGPAFKETGGNTLGLIEICFLGLPRGIRTFQLWLQSKVGDKDYWAHWFWRLPLLFLWLGFSFISLVLSLALTALSAISLVPLLSYLYPFDEDYSNKDSIFFKGDDYVPGSIGKFRRRIFFNPSTWMMGFALFAGVSLLTQVFIANFTGHIINQSLTAGFLLMAQMVFTGVAVLMLVGAVVGLLHHGYELLTTDKELGQKDYPESAVVQYFTDMLDWIHARPKVSIPVLCISGVTVLAVLILTVGYFTGFGFPDVFDFMAPVFQFIGSGFAAGLQHLGTLPGLEALANISGPALELATHIVSGFTLLATAVFTMDTVRQVAQTATEVRGEGPVKLDEEDRGKQLGSNAKKDEKKNKEALFKEAPTPLSPEREQELKAEAATMAARGFKEVKIATRDCSFRAEPSTIAQLMKDERVYLNPEKSGYGVTWGSMGPDATPGWVSDSDVQPLEDLKQLTGAHPK